MRVTEGESYYVSFSDYSENIYQGIARAPIVFSANEGETSATLGVVNILEFQVDIGSFAGIRTVNMEISKSAQGLMISNDLITYTNGVPCVYVESGDSMVMVELDILASDEENSIIREANGITGVLAHGQKLVKP